MKHNRTKSLFAAVVVLAFAVALLPGCKKEPGERVVEHLENAIGIMEQHKDDPEKAAAEINAYAEAHKDELKELEKELDELERDLSQEEKDRRGKEMLESLGGAIERITKLMQENPSLATNEALSEAISKVIPN